MMSIDRFNNNNNNNNNADDDKTRTVKGKNVAAYYQNAEQRYPFCHYCLLLRTLRMHEHAVCAYVESLIIIILSTQVNGAINSAPPPPPPAHINNNNNHHQNGPTLLRAKLSNSATDYAMFRQ